MARSLTNPIQVARMLMMSDRAWLLFVEIARKAGGYYRLVNNGRHLEADGKFWQAASIDVEIPSSDREGTMGRATIRVPNVSRLPMAVVDVDGELLGQRVTIALQHESNLSSFDPALKWTQVILEAQADERILEVTCGHPSQIARTPSRLITRDRFPGLLPTGG
ncbi:MAG: hypothetical protein AMXMBFR58_29690 [Phycisphaerae bacterium]